MARIKSCKAVRVSYAPTAQMHSCDTIYNIIREVKGKSFDYYESQILVSLLLPHIFSWYQSFGSRKLIDNGESLFRNQSRFSSDELFSDESILCSSADVPEYVSPSQSSQPQA